MKQKITKEHRLNDNCHLVDDTDLNIINNTFKEIKHDNNNNFNRIDNTFKLIEKTCESMNTRMNSLEKSVDDKHKTLVFLISIVGIVLTALKIFINWIMKILFLLLVPFLIVLVFFLFVGSFIMNVDFLSTINTSNKDLTFKDHFIKNLKSLKKSLPAVLFMGLSLSLFILFLYFLFIF